MSILLEIPDSVARAMRLPPHQQRQQLIEELAISLYARGILTLGKARELAGLSKAQFGLLLGRHNVPRHYRIDDLKDDLAYAGGQ